ncbi:MAG: hypothetical protein AAGU05_01240 [Anaerolineaceae bacterium]
MKRFGFLLSISLFWLVLSALSGGITALLLPQRPGFQAYSDLPP